MTTTFHSTRSTNDSLTAKQAIRKGIADDGGLFVSDALGKTKVDVASLPGKSYQQIAAEVLGAPRKGLRFVFSGDSAPCPALEQAAQGADLLLCDATYALPEQQEQAAQWGHSTFGQSAALAAKAGAKRLWLVHYSPMVTDPEEHLAQAQSIFPAAECGFDGKRITLHYEENEE